MGVPATTVNKLCLSGLTAIAQAAQQVAAGQYDVVMAGGMGSMSNAPHLLAGARLGLRYGPAQLVDALDRDALVCGFDGISMGAATERYQAGLGISREDQDEFAAESQARAAAAIKAGRSAEEIVPVTVTSRKGEVTVEEDEGVRPGTTAKRLAALPPAFSSSDHRRVCIAVVRRRVRRCCHEQRPCRAAGTALAGRARQLRHCRRSRSLLRPTRFVTPCGGPAR